jgi:hypothetical protein
MHCRPPAGRLDSDAAAKVTPQLTKERFAAMSERVIKVTGPPGAGKSSIAARLARSYSKGVHLYTDDFWHHIVSGVIPPYEPESEMQNHTVLNVIAGNAFSYAAGRFTTVVDATSGCSRRGRRRQPPLPPGRRRGWRRTPA